MWSIHVGGEFLVGPVDTCTRASEMTISPTSRRHSGFSGKIGIARAEMTPPVGIYARNWGAAEHDVADSIHLPLTVSILVLESAEGGEPLILIDGDLGWWRPLSLFKKFQKRILDEVRIDSSRLIFALSHTHAAAPLMEPDPSLPGSGLLGDWLEMVYQTIVAAIHEARGSMFTGRLEWHTGDCRLAAVRDLPDPDNDQRYLCGYNPDREADTTLLVGRITDDAGAVRAVLVNYACHPTTLAWENTAISPDYPGTMRQTIEKQTGAIPFFLLGACGDLAPREQYVGDLEVANRHGRQLAHAALATLNDMNPPGTELSFSGAVESGAPLAVWRPRPVKYDASLGALESHVDLPLKDWPTAGELERQRLACDDRALAERLRRKRDIRRVIGDGQSFPLPINAWRIGDALLTGCCGEAYSVLQQQLRERFPDRAVICMNLINGSIGYLPPSDAYDLDVYPVWQTPFARGSLERMIEGMATALEELMPG